MCIRDRDLIASVLATWEPTQLQQYQVVGDRASLNQVIKTKANRGRRVPTSEAAVAKSLSPVALRNTDRLTVGIYINAEPEQTLKL